MSLTLDAIGIVASDVAKSASFYRLLGAPFGEPGPDDDHFEATLSNGLRLMLDSETLVLQIDPAWRRPQGGPAIGLAFHCGDAAGVDSTYAKVLAAGFKGSKEPWDAFWGQRYAQVADPDGNLVDLFAPL